MLEMEVEMEVEGWGLTVAAVMSPRVPSLPRKSSVRLYPAEVFLAGTWVPARPPTSAWPRARPSL